MKEKEGTKTVERVEVFNFSEKSTPVRVQVINGEPWFVAKDIAEALGYSNPRKAINDHCKEKGVTFRDSLTEGGVQKPSAAAGAQRAQAPANRPLKDFFEKKRAGGRVARLRTALRVQTGWCRRPTGASAGRFIGKTRFF